MSAPQLLVVQNEMEEGLGHLEETFRDAGFSWRTVRAWEGETVPSTLGQHLGLVLLGGPQAVHRAHEWPYLEREMALVREAHAMRAPVLGICLGAQIVAQALGGRALPGPAGPEVGYEPLDLAPEAGDDPLLRHVPADLPVLHLHHDTYEMPPDAVRLASTPRYKEQAFRLGDRTYGLQFHLEFTSQMLALALPQEAADLHKAGVDAGALVAQARRLDGRMAEACRGLAKGFFACGCFD